MTVLVTGAAGFIGYHLAKKLLTSGISVVGLDNINSYYDPLLKLERIKQLDIVSKKHNTSFNLVKSDIKDAESVNDLFDKFKPEKVVNLAAQAGVRYSIENPSAYIESNLVGFANILESCRHHQIKNLLYASSSSVYGGNANLPFSEKDSVDHPMSLYAATKKSNELMAHAYSNLYDLPATGLRFFTVYGPWGRPDMALFLFTKAILEGKPINVFNGGEMTRDFTYVDDIVESLFRLLGCPASSNNSFDRKFPDPSTSWAKHRIFNIGNSNPVPLMDYIVALEKSLGLKAEKVFLPMQPGDVASTSADTSALEQLIRYKPSTPISVGIHNFVSWFKDFYNYK